MRKYFAAHDAVVPMHHPRLLLEIAREKGASVTQLVAGTGIDTSMFSSPHARISYLQFAMLIANALRLTGDPNLGFELGRRMQFTHMGPLGMAIMSSATFGEACEMALRYYRTVSPAWAIAARVEGEHAIVTVEEVIDLHLFRTFGTEALITTFAALSRSLAGLGPHEPFAAQLRIAYPKPADTRGYDMLGAREVLFDCGTTQIIFDAEYLRRPLSSADPLTLELAERLCADRLETEALDEGVVGKIRSVLSASKDSYPSLPEVAKTLQTSPRTLRRTLQVMDTSYSKLLDDARRGRSLDLVERSNWSVERVATMTGFSGARSFRRAFKRWTGMTPEEHRKQRRDINLGSSGVESVDKSA